MHDLKLNGATYPVRRAKAADLARGGKPYPKGSLLAFDPLGLVITHATNRNDLIGHLRRITARRAA